jgi:hypothetical protein
MRLDLLRQVGWKGLFVLVWRGTPPLLRPLALPYGLVVYGRMLASSDSQDILYNYHTDKYQSSRLFKLLRPRYRVVGPLLKKLTNRGQPKCPPA